MNKLGLYIHIPFCDRRCYYCDFITTADKNLDRDLYIKYLKKEILMYKKEMENYIVDTIFIGGGTPSLINPKHIETIIKTIKESFTIADDLELTIETNPGTLNREKLEIYYDIGINRISMGLQSMNDEILKEIGRIHDKETFIKNYKLVREIGFDNVNIDLMFNLPQETDKYLKETLLEVIELEPEHISLYSLILEENTKLYNSFKKGEFNLASEEAERKMYHDSIKLLSQYGYKHYEVSNFSKHNKECRHNLKYWELEPYLGFGLNSHSNIENKRFSNADKFKEYYNLLDENKKPIVETSIISLKEEIFEYVMMNLRLVKGICLNDFKKRYNVDLKDYYKSAIEKNINNGLLVESNGYIRFTGLGMDLSNQFYLDLMD